MDIVEKYGVTKSSIYEWSRKYGAQILHIYKAWKWQNAL